MHDEAANRHVVAERSSVNSEKLRPISFPPVNAGGQPSLRPVDLVAGDLQVAQPKCGRSNPSPGNRFVGLRRSAFRSLRPPRVSTLKSE
jgi:hypothetical protein